MKESDPSATLRRPSPEFLAQLEQTFGWSEQQALEALGAYLMSTKAGQALRREQESCSQASRAA